jgi:hypothetical protein
MGIPSPIKLPEELILKAKEAGKKHHRSVPKQVQHWAEVGEKYEISMERLAKIATACKENPDLPYDFVEDLVDIIESKEECMPFTDEERYGS